MVDFVVVVILVVLVGAALAYIIRSKKAGKCIGCPDAKTCTSHQQGGNTGSVCGGNCGSCGGCGFHTDAK